MKRIIIALIALTANLCSFAASQRELAVAAERSYRAGDYDRSAEILLTIATQYGTSPELYLDLGNSYLQASDYGHAVVAYMRGLRLDPRDSRLRSNLAFALSKVDDRNMAALKGKSGNVAPDAPSAFQSIGRAITDRVHSDTWAACGIISFLLAIAAAAAYLFVAKVVVRKIGFFSFFILISASLLFNLFAFAAAARYRSQTVCVVTSYGADLTVQPGAKSQKTGFTLSAGTPLDILQEDKADGVLWYKVKLNSENIGWIESKNIEKI